MTEVFRYPFIAIINIIIIIVNILCNAAVGPKLRRRPRNVVTAANSDHDFVCDIYANPPPVIYWLKNGANLTVTDYVQVVNSRSLRILGLLPSDAGMYQCMAVAGEMGSLQAAAQLIVHAPGMLLTIQLDAV